MKIFENDRVLVSRLEGRNCWSVITNPHYGFSEEAMSNILFNAANNYVEYKNCGVIYRMIRHEDLADYGIDANEVLSDQVLPQTPPEGEKNTIEVLKTTPNKQSTPCKLYDSCEALKTHACKGEHCHCYE